MGRKHWANTWTEVEDLGKGKFAAEIHVGHKVFKDKTDGLYKKHKITDKRPDKDYIVVQSAKCCVEVYPYYARYFDIQHEEVRLHEERWVVQRWRDPPGKWQDIGAWNPIIATEETNSGITVTINYTTDYGPLTVKYIQRDGAALKHDILFTNTSGGTETFRVVQAWAGIVGDKCNGQDFPLITEASFLAFHDANKPKGKFNIAENLHSMIFNPDGSEKTDQCLQKPISIETHAQGMKADFIYGDWILDQDESLEIDPATATLDDPALDRSIYYNGSTYIRGSGDFLYSGKSGVNTFRSFIEWDISSIPESATISDTVFKYHCHSNSIDCHIHEMLGTRPSTTADDPAGNQTIYDEAAEGTVYAAPAGFPEVGTNKSVDLGTDADSDLEDQLSLGWLAIGTQSDNEGTAALSRIYSSDYAEVTPPPTLYVEYEVVPDQVTGVSATDGVHTDKVVITWDVADGATGYDVWNGSSWVDVGDVQTYDHTGAPAPTITPGTVSASDGTSADHVTLSIAGESANNGSSISYKVRAYNVTGDGPESDPDSGYRGVGALTYQWQRSAGDSDADYSNIDGATTDPYNDTGAPANGNGRYYKCVENATGAAEQTTNADRGYRILVFEYVGTGTFAYSGAATIIIGFTYAGSGELTYSGTASQIYSKDYLSEGSGNFVTSGSGSYYYEVPDWEYVGSGELAYSGEATQSHTKYFLYDTSGNFVFSGTGIYSLGFAYIGSGSLIYSGEATQIYTKVFSCVASGALSFSGAGTYFVGFAFVGSGTYNFSGVVLYSLGLSYVGSGNFITSGLGSYYCEITDWEYTGSGVFNYSGKAVHRYKVDFTEPEKTTLIYTKPSKGTATYTEPQKGTTNFTEPSKKEDGYVEPPKE